MSPYFYDCTGLGSAYRYGYGYGYGYGWYPGGYPVTIIYNGGGSSSRPHGRVVNGEGYVKGTDAVSADAVPRLPDVRSQTTSGASSGGYSPSSSSTSGSSDQRTAKPRPPK